MRAEAPWPLDSLAAPGPREAAERTTASPARRAHAAQRNRRGGNGTGDGRRVSAKESIQVTVPRRGPGTAPAHVPGVPVPDLSLQSGHLHVPSSSRRIHSSALRTAGGNPGHSTVSASCEIPSLVQSSESCPRFIHHSLIHLGAPSLAPLSTAPVR